MEEKKGYSYVINAVWTSKNIAFYINMYILNKNKLISDSSKDFKVEMLTIIFWLKKLKFYLQMTLYLLTFYVIMISNIVM